MKKIIILFAVLGLFGSCSLLSDMRYSVMLSDIELYDYDFGEIKSLKDISKWIYNNVSYKKTPIAQTPEETIFLGSGGCLAKAILFCNIAYFELGIEMSVIAVNTNRSIIEGGIVDHAEVYYNGVCYSVNYGISIDTPIGYIYRFNEVFRAEN